MSENLAVLIVENIDLLFDALTTYMLKLASAVSFMRVRQIGELLELANNFGRYDLVIVDADLPGLMALPLFDTLMKTLAGSPLVVLVGDSCQEDAVRAIECGAKVYIPKSMPGPAVIAGLGLALCGYRFIPSHDRTLSFPLKDVASDVGAAMGARPDPRRNFTTRQLAILDLLAEGKTGAEIADCLGIANSTVRFHLRRAYRRLGVRNRAEAVRIVLREFSTSTLPG